MDPSDPNDPRRPADPATGDGTPAVGWPTPGDRAPGDRAPGDRAPGGTRPSATDGGPAPVATDWGRPSPLRAVVFGSVVAGMMAAIVVVFGGVLSLTAGLIVLALFLGRFVAFGVTAGAGGETTLGSGARLAIAIAIAFAALLLAQAGLWGIAWLQGGRLGFVDFLAETYGALVPLQFLLAAGGAWWGTR